MDIILLNSTSLCSRNVKRASRIMFVTYMAIFNVPPKNKSIATYGTSQSPMQSSVNTNEHKHVLVLLILSHFRRVRLWIFDKQLDRMRQ